MGLMKELGRESRREGGERRRCWNSVRKKETREEEQGAKGMIDDVWDEEEDLFKEGGENFGGVVSKGGWKERTGGGKREGEKERKRRNWEESGEGEKVKESRG